MEEVSKPLANSVYNIQYNLMHGGYSYGTYLTRLEVDPQGINI